MSTVLEFPVEAGARTAPSTVRIGLLGLGHIGSALVHLARDATTALQAAQIAPAFTAALVRSTRRPHPASDLVAHVTDDVESFFAQPMDLVIEAMGGVEPAHTLVRRALLRRLPVITANKSLIAAHGESLSALARQQQTALRYEASCIAGVPFLGTFERRPLACRVDAVTAILNGTSNAILTRMEDGATFGDALEDAQRLGLAEPDPAMDVSGADGAEKLTILLRLFARLIVAPRAISTRAIDALTPADLLAARGVGGVIKPIARASWRMDGLDAFVGPALVGNRHPLGAVNGSTNGIVLHAAGGQQFYSGPGAGPDVTAATLLDEVAELAVEGIVRSPSRIETRGTARIGVPAGRWLVRASRPADATGLVDLLAVHDISCSTVITVAGNAYGVTDVTPADRVASADVLALPVIEPLDERRC